MTTNRSFVRRADAGGTSAFTRKQKRSGPACSGAVIGSAAAGATDLPAVLRRQAPERLPNLRLASLVQDRVVL
jgi:hypothetical protein